MRKSLGKHFLYKAVSFDNTLSSFRLRLTETSLHFTIMLSKHFLNLYRTRYIPSLAQVQFCSIETGGGQSLSPPPLASSSAKSIKDISIINGLPHVTVPLPSRNELCVFALKPVSNTVGDWLEMLKQEDRGIDRAVIRNQEGVRISSRTSIQTLFDQKFILSINDTDYDVIPPALESLSKEDLRKISDVKLLVSQLYEALNIDDYQ